MAFGSHSDPFIYDSFGAGIDGTMQPGTDPEAPIHLNAPKDDGTTTAPSGTLQAYLDKIAKSIKDIKGTNKWDDTVAQSLTQAITWRSPVVSANALPTNGNRIGDIRYVIQANMLYVWTSSGWRSPGIDGVAASGGSSGSQIAMMQTGASGISAFQPVVRSSEGLKVADAANIAHAGNFVGITLESAAQYQQVMVQTSGVVTFPNSIFGTQRGSVLLGVGGNIVRVTAPGSMFIQNIGTIVGTKELHLHIDGTIVMLLDPAPLLVPAGSPVGGGSTSGADAYYVHPQLAPATIWYVIHNLGKHPAVSLEDLDGNEVEANVIYTSNNTLEVHFTNPFAGRANCS